MRERFRNTPSFDLEDKADAALRSGTFADAEDYLADLLQTFPHPDKYHHAILKLTALPLYEMAYGIALEEREAVYEEADATYGLVGQLLQDELRTYSPSFHEEVGRISELTFFALKLRQFLSEEANAVILPAPAIDDKKDIDFYMSPVGTKRITDGQAYQIKTRATAETRERYQHSKTTLISMDDIDKYAAKPDHPKSLPRTILRELGISFIGDNINPEGLSEGADKNRLDRACDLIEKIASGTITNATARALTRTTIQALEMDAA